MYVCVIRQEWSSRKTSSRDFWKGILQIYIWKSYKLDMSQTLRFRLPSATSGCLPHSEA